MKKERYIVTRIEVLREQLADIMFEMTMDDPDYSDPIWEVYGKLDEADGLCSDAIAVTKELMNAEEY